MRKTDFMKEMILVNKLKKEDPLELPMDEIFFENLHDKIMSSVEKAEIKPLSKWTKTWVFLEQKTVNQRAKLKKVAKLSITITSLTVGIGLIKFSVDIYKQTVISKVNLNKSLILLEARKNPIVWSELALSYQNENDFYADILSQRSIETIVEIDKVFVQSL